MTLIYIMKMEIETNFINIMLSSDENTKEGIKLQTKVNLGYLMFFYNLSQNMVLIH